MLAEGASPDESVVDEYGAQPVDVEELQSAFNEDSASAFLQGLLNGSFTLDALPDPDRGELALGTALAESGDLPGAIGTLLEAIRLGGSDNQVEGALFAPAAPLPSQQRGPVEQYVYLGHTRMLSGDLRGAIASYRDAIRIHPEESIEARYGLGAVLAESGDSPGATAAIRDAIESDQEHLPGPFRLLWATTMSKHPTDVIAALERVRNHASGDRTSGRAIEARDRAIRGDLQERREASNDPSPLVPGEQFR